jgi:hypothetical protein
MFERYTEKARQTIHFAKSEAQRVGSREVNPEHLLLGLLSDAALIGSLIQPINVEKVREAVAAHFPQGERLSTPADLPLSQESQQALHLAAEEAASLASGYIGNEHILLGLLQNGNGYVSTVLRESGISAETLRIHAASSLLQERVPHESALASGVTEPLEPALKELIRSTVQKVTELKGRGENRAALNVLDEIMAAQGEDCCLKVRLFGPMATVTALQVKDFPVAERYCQLRLACDPKDPMVLFDLADCLKQQGKTGKAEEWAAKSYEQSLSRGGGYGQTVIELLKMRFPEVKAT